MWIEAVEGLEAASHRMRLLATEKPGEYFVFCTQTNKVLNAVDTRPIHITHVQFHLAAMLRRIKQWFVSAPPA